MTARSTADLGPAVDTHVEWLRVRELSEATIRTRLCVLRLIAAAIAPKPLLEATEPDLDGWQLQLKRSGLCAASRRTYVDHLAQFFRWAHGRGLIRSDPSLILVRPRVARGRPHPIPEVDLDTALQLATPRVRAFLALAAGAGLRACEIADLERADILDTLAKPMIVVRFGKGRKTRMVPLAPWVWAVLVEYGLPSAGPLFRLNNGRQVGGGNVTRICGDYLHSLGIPRGIHSGRHRFATALYRATKDLRLVQEILGHESPVTTSIYTSPDGDAATAAIAGLGLGRFGGPETLPSLDVLRDRERARSVPPERALREAVSDAQPRSGPGAGDEDGQGGGALGGAR